MEYICMYKYVFKNQERFEYPDVISIVRSA